MANVVLTARDEKFIASMKRAAGAVGELSATMNVKLKQSFKEVDYVQRQFTAGLGRLGNQIQGIGQNMSTYITAPMALASAGILKTYSDIQKLQMGLQDYGVSMAEIQQIARTPGLGIEEVGRSLQKLADSRFNIETSKKAVVEFGNALARAGRGKEELDGIFTAFSQMKGKGKVQAEEINQIAERLPIIRTLMTDVFGTSDTEKLQKLGITADEFLVKITERLAEMPRAASGLDNALGNIFDKIKIGAYEIGLAADKLFDFNAITEKVEGVINAVINTFKSFSPEVQRLIFVVGGVVVVMGPVLAALGGIIALSGPIVAALATISAPMLAIGASAAAGVALLMINFDTVAPYIADMMDSIGIVFDTAYYLISGIWGELAQLLGGTTNGIFADLLAIVSDGLRIVAELFRFTAAVFTGDWDTAWASIETIVKRAWNGIVNTMAGAVKVGINIMSAFANVLGLEGQAASIKETNAYIDALASNIKFKIAPATATIGNLKKALNNITNTTTPKTAGGTGKAAEAKRSPFGGVELQDLEIRGAKDFFTNSKFISEMVEGQKNMKEQILSGFENTIDAEGVSERMNNRLAQIQLDVNKLILPLTDTFALAQEEMQLRLDEMSTQLTEKLQDLAIDTIGAIGEGIGSGEGIAGAFKGLLHGLGGALQQVGKQFLLANETIKALKLKLGTTLGIGGSIAAIALGGVIKGLANKIQVPKLAQGGLAFGPTYAMVGDNRNAGIDPEVIAPLSKLKNIIGSGGGEMNYTVKIQGQDILLALRRAERSS